MSKLFKLIRVPQDGIVTRNRQQPSKLLYILTTLNDVETRAMIDTGSTISAINATYFQKINNNYYVYPSQTSCETANNTQLLASAMVVMPIKINTFIIENLCTDLLLGRDFCELFNAQISYEKRYLSINTKHQYTTVSFLQHTNEQRVLNVNTIHEVIIPPLSGKVVRATTAAPYLAAVFTPSHPQKTFNNGSTCSDFNQ